jgi:ribose/xylose/arabinose/galactoside ABC-type transport system permease subunit
VGLLLALDAISAAVVGGTYLFGGKGSIGGILVGTLFLASIQNGLNLEGVATYWQYIVSGTVLLGAVAVDQLAQRRTEREFV